MKKRLAFLVSAFLILGLTFGMSYTHKVSATAPGINQLMNQDSTGTYANGRTYEGGARLSGDGRYVAFDSTASNLVSGDTNGYADVFLKDTSTGAITRVSVTGTNTQINQDSEVADISYDGRYVVFATGPANLLLMRDTATNTTISVTGGPGTACTAGSYGFKGGAISADGKYVTYTIKNTPAGLYQAVVENVVTRSCKVLSSDSLGNAGNANSYPGGISCDGGVISFYSDSTNLPNGSGGYLASVDTNGTLQLTKVPIQLDSEVSCDGNEIASWKSTTSYATEYNRLTGQATILVPGTGILGSTTSVSLSNDGRFAAVDTNVDLDTSYPSTGAGSKNDIYVLDTQNSTAELISFTVSGNRSGYVPYDPGYISISANGSKVAYPYTTPSSTDTSHELISGLTTGTSANQDDIYTSETGF